MTRIDSVRAATDTAKESVLHAAEAVAPHAGTAKHRARHYAHETRVRVAPKMSHAARQARSTARSQYGAHLQPRIEQGIGQARGALPPKVDAAAQRAAASTRKAARQTRKAARQAADYTRPRVEHAVADARAAAEPVREEALARSAAALAALRGQVSPAEIEKLVKRRNRRARTGRAAKRLTVLGVLAGCAFAVWHWWDKQANPDWLVEPPAATEPGDRAPLTAVDSSDETALDPEIQAKQAETEGTDRDDQQ